MGRIPSGKKKDCTHQERLLLDIQTKIAAMVGREEIVEPAIILPHFSLPGKFILILIYLKKKHFSFYYSLKLLIKSF